ncbi:RNA-binding protein 48 [Musca vetustissima]|uniref:RNA-binding protein 48 n=1 Tax=Musca vetustissima TaxID=27455 RepID=UPI002AB71912|nr:RNA-binding protein 48 [Musca vetustissima]
MSDDSISHHKQFKYCTTRLKYRQGRELKAVKVYTVANESLHLLCFGVPKINLHNEVKQNFRRFGELCHVRNVTAELLEKGAELEAFTEVFWIKFKKIFDARKAKKYLDAKEFYGGILHISYAPEYETMEELRAKLQHRMSEVKYRLRVNAKQHKMMKNEEESTE